MPTASSHPRMREVPSAVFIARKVSIEEDPRNNRQVSPLARNGEKRRN